MSVAEDINNWLISEGRVLGEAGAIVEAYTTRLVGAGVPLCRANIAQRYANPLLAAWGVVWTPESTTPYDVQRSLLDTRSYIGGPFEYVRQNRKPLHKSLVGLDPETEHAAYLELAEGGGTDLFANFLEYGDGSIQGCTYLSDAPEGFQSEHIDLIQSTRFGLASAMEPVSMRKSAVSLLQTYLGDGPARAVSEGTIQRGEHTAIEAVVMFTDLRGFTEKSETWNETRLLTALNGYFDAVVQSVEKNGGDVLKFMGDGILSIFPVETEDGREGQCQRAVRAAQDGLKALDALNEQRDADGEEELAMGVGLNRGLVTYGNIGSPDRLDFTVLGPAVNVASRVQDLCKVVGASVLATRAVADFCPDMFTEGERYPVKGVADPIQIFELRKT